MDVVLVLSVGCRSEWPQKDSPKFILKTKKDHKQQYIYTIVKKKKTVHITQPFKV